MFANLHSHDLFSPLDGSSSAEEYFSRASEIGMPAIAQTNHGSLAGWREWQRQAKTAGIKGILGYEGYLTRDRFDRTSNAKRSEGDAVYNHIILLAQNEVGYNNLMKIDEISWAEGFYHKNRFDFEVLEEHSEGIIALSGCMSGVISKAIENDNPELADALTLDFKRIFGERFFIEQQIHNPEKITQGLKAIAEKHNVLQVVTSDAHHARKEDLWVQEAMLILSTNPKFEAKGFDLSKAQKMDWLERFNYMYPDRKMTFQEFNLHVNSYDEWMAGIERVGLSPDVVTNTSVVADMVDDASYPYYEALDLLPHTAENVDDLLEKKVRIGLKNLGKDTDPVYVERARHELDIIKSKGFSPYFHVADKAIAWAKKQGILTGPGRGSGAGSLVVYALGLTKVDPIEHNLIFARFIDPSRPDWPDLDLDFQDTRREEVKNYMRRQYKNVSSIATFGYFKDKSAIKAAARVLKIPLNEVNKATKSIESMDDYQKSPKTEEFRRKYPEVLDLAVKLHGKLQNTGMHAGGLIVSREPISNYAPVQTAVIPKDPTKTRVPVAAVDMNEAADIGFIKFDFLGLKALTIIKDTLDLIRTRRGESIDIDNLPMDDKRVYEMLSKGFTKFVFQCEAAPYTKLLISMKGVKNFDELAASNALVRPGAMNSSFGEQYINGKNGGLVQHIHPDVQPYTIDTYGSILYQEQQMYLCTELAGMTMEESNKVRKAIGKKKADELAKWKEPFIEGASQKISRAKAEALWTDLEAAGDYSFNKSHAVAYSMISYQTAWLKVHYPLEFVAANLKNEKDKDSRMDYLMEARRMGIRVLMPHVNSSDVDISIQRHEGAHVLRLGLADVKYISEKLASRIIEHRPYRNYTHFRDVVTTKGSGLNTRVLDSLNKVGGAVFSDNPLRGDERDNFFEYLSIPALPTKALPPIVTNQMLTFDDYSDTGAFVCMGMTREVKVGKGWALVSALDETGSAGFFTEENTPIEVGKMYVFLIADNRIARYISVEDLMEGKGGDFRQFLGATGFPDVPDGMMRVVSFKPRLTKKGNRMANAVFSTNNKELFAVSVWPQQFMKAFGKCKEGEVVDVKLAQTDDGTIFLDNIL